ncbi:MAG: hypothetical protein ACKVHU_18705 [Acidimicrobiales bacterium]|jgi:hypothetical protein
METHAPVYNQSQLALPASSLRIAVDHLAHRVFHDDPIHTLTDAGLTDVRAYVITVGGESRHYLTGVAPNGEVLDATAWSAPAAAALVLGAIEVGAALAA